MSHEQSNSSPSDAAHAIWDALSRSLRSQVSDAVWSTTFNDIRVIDLRDNKLSLAVPSSLVKERLEGKFLGFIESAVAENGGGDLFLDYQIHTHAADGDLPSDPLAQDPRAERFAPPSAYNPDDLAEIDLTKTPPEVTLSSSAVADAARQAIGEPIGGGIGIDDGQTGGLRPQPFRFEDFVIGQSNRFAHAAALAVAERPALAYNPLFIYGDAGLGKTHLLRAIANYVADHYPHYSVLYVSSEEFLNDFVEAIRLSTLPDFKRRYREVDLLLVDDIQFIEGKEGFQEEFFHTFNALHQGQRQIVVSSDRPPDSIPTLEDRLRSRFKMGLITDIQPPDLETRLAILRQKGMKSEHGNPPDDVLQFIAANIIDNIRELEGALIRVTAFGNLTNEALTVSLAEKVLGDTLSDRQPHQITPALILDCTSEMFDLSIDDIIGGSRRRPLVTARQVAMYVMREATDLSYPAIAREFGGRDHTTVIYAVEKIGNLMAERRQIFDQVTELTAKIKSSD